jgi:hypothetical protein
MSKSKDMPRASSFRDATAFTLGNNTVELAEIECCTTDERNSYRCTRAKIMQVLHHKP